MIGLDLTVTLAASAGQLQLNVMEPVITFALFIVDRDDGERRQQPARQLRAGHHRQRRAHPRHGAELARHRHGAEAPLGYKQCAEIAREGYETGKSLHQIVVKERKLLTQEKWDEVFSFENLISPKFEQ